MPDYILTNHAKERLEERFPDVVDHQELINNTVLVGGQRGKEYALLNEEKDMAFIIAIDDKGDKIVKTILTKAMLYANLNARNSFSNIPFQPNREAIISNRENAHQHLSQKARRREYHKSILAEEYDELLPIMNAIAARYSNGNITVEEKNKINVIFTSKFKISDNIIELFWKGRQINKSPSLKSLLNLNEQVTTNNESYDFDRPLFVKIKKFLGDNGFSKKKKEMPNAELLNKANDILRQQNLSDRQIYYFWVEYAWIYLDKLKV